MDLITNILLGRVKVSNRLLDYKKDSSLLKGSSEDVTDKDPFKPGGGMERLPKKLAEIMYGTNAVGIAAPQIGIFKRVIVIDISKDKNSPFVLVNPEIIEHSEETNIDFEGCLNFPGKISMIRRYDRVVVKYRDLYGENALIDASGFLARVLQHEIDHLNGVLICDREIHAAFLDELKKEV